MTMTKAGNVANPLVHPNDDAVTAEAKKLAYPHGLAWQPFEALLRKMDALEKRLEKCTSI